MDRSNALLLLHQHVSSQSLRTHCLAVAFAMEEYAHYYEQDSDEWWICGLLHDFDYEKHPSLQEHPYKGAELLTTLGCPQSIVQAILGHGDHTGVPRITPMAKTLFAVDELSGFVVALAKVRPARFEGMDISSVEKALKKKGFAQAISRPDIDKGIVELGISRDEHIKRVIIALQNHAHDLGF